MECLFLKQQIRKGQGCQILLSVYKIQRDLVPLILQEIDKDDLLKLIKEGLSEFVLKNLNPLLLKRFYEDYDCNLDMFFGETDNDKLVTMLSSTIPSEEDLSDMTLDFCLYHQRKDLVIKRVEYLLLKERNILSIEEEGIENIEFYDINGFVSFEIDYIHTNDDEEEELDLKTPVLSTNIKVADYLDFLFSDIIVMEGDEFKSFNYNESIYLMKDGYIAGILGKDNYIDTIIGRKHQLIDFLEIQFPFKVLENGRIKYTPYYVRDKESISLDKTYPSEIDKYNSDYFWNNHGVFVSRMPNISLPKENDDVLISSMEYPDLLILKSDSRTLYNRYYYSENKCHNICSNDENDIDYGFCEEGIHRVMTY